MLSPCHVKDKLRRMRKMSMIPLSYKRTESSYNYCLEAIRYEIVLPILMSVHDVNEQGFQSLLNKVTHRFYVDVILPRIAPLIDIELRDYYWIADRERFLVNDDFIAALNDYWSRRGVMIVSEHTNEPKTIDLVLSLR